MFYKRFFLDVNPVLFYDNFIYCSNSIILQNLVAALNMKPTCRAEIGSLCTKGFGGSEVVGEEVVLEGAVVEVMVVEGAVVEVMMVEEAVVDVMLESLDC